MKLFLIACLMLVGVASLATAAPVVSNLTVTPSPAGLTFRADITPGADATFNQPDGWRVKAAIGNLLPGPIGHYQILAHIDLSQRCNGSRNLAVYAGLNTSSLILLISELPVEVTPTSVSFTLPLALFGTTTFASWNFSQEDQFAGDLCLAGGTQFGRVGLAPMVFVTRPKVFGTR